MIVDTRITPTHNKNGKANKGIGYQHQVCGKEEYLVTDGTNNYWADGIDGKRLVDAKVAKKGGFFRGNGSRKMQQRIHKSQVNEFTRIRKIIQNSEWEGFTLITTSEEAIPFFANVIEDAGFNFDDVQIVIER